MNRSTPQAGPQKFATTCWSMVLRAGASRPCRESLERLCRAYWAPIYQTIRHRGHSQQEAEDLTQDFFIQLLRYESFGTVEKERGRFRSFLLASLKNFLVNDWHRKRRMKRGGGQTLLSFDAIPGFEKDVLPNIADVESPDIAFDRTWATTLLARVNARLRSEYTAAGQENRFDTLKGFLLAGDGSESYLECAARLGLSESAVKSAIYKMRQRYGNLLRAEICATVEDPSDVEDEIRCLLLALY